MKLSLLFIIFLSLSACIAAQRTCSFHSTLNNELKINSQLACRKQNFENQFLQWQQQLKTGSIKLPDTIFIPLVFHVLWHIPEENITDSQIISQVRILNEDFNAMNADTNNTPDYFKPFRGRTHFYFQLAKQDPDGIPANGINRVYTLRRKGFGLDGSVSITRFGGQDAWDPRYYVNIWVCNMEQLSGTFASTYFPGGSNKRDGIQCDYHYVGTGGITQPPYNLGRTITHEMGHYFNLDHTWGPTDYSNIPYCGDDDHVEDTPPQSRANYYCPSFPKSSCGNVSDMYMNYMDYTDDPCMNMFSRGQAERMIAAWYIMTPNLRNSKALQTPHATVATDAGITAILKPADNSLSCNTSTRFVVALRNFGTDTMYSVRIVAGIKTESKKYYQIFSIDSLFLPPFTTDTFVLKGKFYFDTSGSLTFFATTILPNKRDDMNLENNEASIHINISDGNGIALPYHEDFSNKFFPPKGISLENPDDLFGWTPTTGAQLSGYAPSAMMDNIEYPFPGEKDYMILPPMDLSKATSPVLKFDHAYQLYKPGKRSISDTLAVEVSADCGASWSRIFYKGGGELATVRPAQFGYFSPDKKSDWQTNSLNLSAWAGLKNVWIRFVNINGEENLLYIDNIVVEDGGEVIAMKQGFTK